MDIRRLVSTQADVIRATARDRDNAALPVRTIIADFPTGRARKRRRPLMSRSARFRFRAMATIRALATTFTVGVAAVAASVGPAGAQALTVPDGVTAWEDSAARVTALTSIVYHISQWPRAFD
jgi:hypothetical protein